MKNRKTSKENSVDVSVKKPVESTGENRLTEVVQIQREEGKDSLKMMMTNTCSERKQPEKAPVKAVEKRKHSGSKKSKAQKTVTKSPNHGQNPVQTQKKALNNRVKRSGNEKEERVVPHTESKRVRLEEETKTVEQKVLLCEEKMSSVMSSKKSNLDVPDVPVEDVDGCTDRRIAIPYGIRNTAYSDFSGFGEIGGRQGLSSGDMSWVYSRSLSNGSFG